VRLCIPSLLDELKEEPLSYWTDLAKEWLLEAPASKVFMLPDVKLGRDLKQDDESQVQERQKQLGEGPLKKLKSEVHACIEENKVEIDDKFLKSMPCKLNSPYF
jgi:Zn-dependent M16 (insulinase) family peptidase